MNPITVISLGPGQGECLTISALKALKTASQVILRTAHTDSAAFLARQGIAFQSLDHLYETVEDFDELNEALVHEVLLAAERAPVLYAVLDAQHDQTVLLLREKAPDCIALLPGVGMFDVLACNHPDARVCAADNLPDALGDEPLLVIEMDNSLLAGEVKLKLLGWFGAGCPCTWYPPMDASIRKGVRISLEDLDRQRRYDHTAALYIAPQPLTEKERYTVHDLVQIMRILRAPDGCPWDREQTHKSLRPYLIEEAYEVTQAVNDEDWDHVADELGDVLLQVVFQANIGDQYGTFELSDVTTAICRKMIRRHPHIFGEAEAKTASDVTRRWEAIKQKERGQKGIGDVMSDIPASLPPLMRAQKALRRAKSAGVCRSAGPEDAIRSLREAVERVASCMTDREAMASALGELLFASVNTARTVEIDCETALSDATEAYIREISARNPNKSPENIEKT